MFVLAKLGAAFEGE